MKMYKIFQVLFFISFFSISCTKTSSVQPVVEHNKFAGGFFDKATQKNGAEAIGTDFHELSPSEYAGMNVPSFETMDEVKQYLNSVSTEINTNFNGQTILMNSEETINLPSPEKNCTTAGTYTATFTGSGGMFSTFRGIFQTSRTGIISSTLYTTGTNIGWSWNQLGSSLSNYSGCTYGTITWGAEVGGVVFGYTQDYHFSYTINPYNCTILWTQGSGICNSAIM
jgi:hypothetical protein